MHHIIIIGVIIVIVLYQLKIFRNTSEKLKKFREIFADNKDAYKLLKDKQIDFVINANDEDLQNLMHQYEMDVAKYHYTRYTAETGEILCFKRAKAIKDLLEIYENTPAQIVVDDEENQVFTEISSSINEYLSANEGSVSDFHLMKDILDRNCDAKEEEINTQIPVPLYLGLVGTMVGILVGIGYLWISGGLSDLLNSGNENSGADGVEALLGGVALAMVSSILGILLTTFGSMKAQTTKALVERNKHIFLSWMQAKLLPNLSNDTVQTLNRMSQNLTAFNNTFSSNTSDLSNALSQVNEAVVLQKQLLDAVGKIADKNLAVQNIQLYDALKNSTKEIGTLAEYLYNTNDYLANVRALNEKLDKNEQRNKALEEMAMFFKIEISQIEHRKDTINKAVGTIDSILEERLRILADHASDNLENFYKALGKQQDALQKKLDETQIIISELKNLSAIKDSIAKFERAMSSQNSKLENLSASILLLAKAKTEGMSISTIDPKHKMIVWKKLLIWSIIAVGGVILFAILIANWNTIYYEFIHNFKF